jgi:predicted GNAT family N-acyltransferase
MKHLIDRDMENSIVTNFCIGSDECKQTLSFITAATAREKYAGKVLPVRLKEYIQKKFSTGALDVDMNSLSNQFLVVYADGEVAGYARLTSKGSRPEVLNGKSIIRIADFAVLKKFDDVRVKKNLFEKCLSACGLQQIVWMSEYEQNPDVDFFTSYGFVKNTSVTGVNELGLPLVYLVLEKQ